MSRRIEREENWKEREKQKRFIVCVCTIVQQLVKIIYNRQIGSVSKE